MPPITIIYYTCTKCGVKNGHIPQDYEDTRHPQIPKHKRQLCVNCNTQTDQELLYDEE